MTKATVLVLKALILKCIFGNLQKSGLASKKITLL